MATTEPSRQLTLEQQARIEAATAARRLLHGGGLLLPGGAADPDDLVLLAEWILSGQPLAQLRESINTTVREGPPDRSFVAGPRGDLRRRDVAEESAL
jgi:hypothetical protein